MRMIGTISLNVDGLGIIMYSAFAVAHIQEGENYLEPHYWRDADMLEHVYKGTIVGFCTGSPGSYILRFYEGYPTNDDAYQCLLKLGIEVRAGRVFVRDLYDLLRWTATCPAEQSLAVDDGFYGITLGTGYPPSGIIGDDQPVDVYLHRLDRMPRLDLSVIPSLFPRPRRQV